MSVSFIAIFKILPFVLLSLIALADHYGTVSVLAHSHTLYTEYTSKIFENQDWQEYVDLKRTSNNFDDIIVNANTSEILNKIEWETGNSEGRTDASPLESELSSHVYSAYQATQLSVNVLVTTLTGVAIILVGLFEVSSTKTVAGLLAYRLMSVGMISYIALGSLIAWRARKCFLNSNPLSSGISNAMGCQYMIEYGTWLYVLFNTITIIIVLMIESLLP